MAEESGLEKTEPASPRRLEKAREEGDVPRSRELGTCAVLLAAGSGLWFAGDMLMRSMKDAMSSGLSLDRDQIYDPNVLFARIASDLAELLIVFSPIAVLIMVAAIASPLLVGGWLVSGKAIGPNFGKLNPLRGLTNMVSRNALVELLKAMAKALLVGGVSWVVITREMPQMMTLALEPVPEGSAHLGSLLWWSFLAISGGLILIAVIDAPYQMWHYANKLKMTRQEVKEEAKESEGDPQIKARIRSQQREMARRRMMSEVPDADVVVTNPTHFAVALKYKDGAMRAPKVVAKGADEVAAKIREIASSSNVPLLEAPPLARALYRHAELGDEIPEALYAAVAEVLAYVFQLQVHREKGGPMPAVPDRIAVPTGMDPLNTGTAGGAGE